MNEREAHELLGTNSDSSPEDIRRAYLVKARTRHPDLNPNQSADLMVNLNLARDLLTRVAKEDYCRECGGKGRVTITRGFVSLSQHCATCAGTGKRWR